MNKIYGARTQMDSGLHVRQNISGFDPRLAPQFSQYDVTVAMHVLETCVLSDVWVRLPLLTPI